ncbi:MAG TPA: DUF2585 family protein [Sphingomonas sp.]|nr:DUF2585 family protein [Sphingomonas sp.]
MVTDVKRVSALRRSHTAAAFGIVGLAALIEWVRGRPPLCRCGHVRLWTSAVHGPENSQQIADWYSLSHVIHGLIFFGLLWWAARRLPPGSRLLIAVAIEAAWELIENSPLVIERYRAATMAWGYSGDSILNSMADIGFMAMGFLIAARLPWRASLLIGLALELIALAAIRDNLTLNILMLVHPIDAIRVWQGG